MTLSRVSLRSFLQSAKATLANASQQTPPLTFIVGNESADLDSLCSAVVLAYLRTYSSTSKSSTLYIPLSNIPRADLPLRPELLPVLSKANIDLSDIITLSDLPPSNQAIGRLSPERTNWILVDHNALTGELAKSYDSRVVGCIDHHDEENKVHTDCIDEPRIVQKSGSCSSLVVDYCREAWDALAEQSANEDTVRWDAEMASLALAPVLIDTTNLTSKSKTTPADTETAEYLTGNIKAHLGDDFSADEYFNDISKAKADIEGLSLAECLRKDYKQWTEGDSVNLGISSVVQNMSYLLGKTRDQKDFLQIVKKHAVERSLSICCIMTTSHEDSTFRREIFLWALNENGVRAAQKFEAESKEKLGLKEWKVSAFDTNDDGQWRRCWWQDRVENSRKQVAPLLRIAMKQA